MRTWPLAFVVAGCSVGHPPNTDPLAGDWEGMWTKDGDTIAIHQHFARTDSGYTGNFSSPDLRVVEIPFSAITASPDTVGWSVVGDESTTAFTGQVGDDALHGTFTENDAHGAFHLRRAAARPAIRSTDVTFRSGEAVLAGTILLPPGQGPFPGIVFLHGSGPEGRWSSRFLAHAFAEAGVAALIFDKRGIGSSTGDWRTAGFDTLTQDALAAVAVLRGSSEVMADRVGIHGHSQGGMLVPLVAASDSTLAFVVASAPSGLPMDSLERFSVLNQLGASAMDPVERALAERFVDAVIATAYHDAPYPGMQVVWREVSDRPWAFEPPPPDDPYWTFSRTQDTYDPMRHWCQVRVPALILFGEADQRVPAQLSMERIQAAYERCSGRKLAVLMYPHADHAFRLRTADTAWPRSATGYPEELIDHVKRMLGD